MNRNPPLTDNQISDHLAAASQPARTPALAKLREFSRAQIRQAMDDQSGFCTNCGAEQKGCEPDAREYKCDDCEQSKVYGAVELALMGWA
jgi:hypothetical protein